MGRQARTQVVAYAGHLVEQLQYALRTTFPAAVLRSDAFCQICAETVDLAAQAHEDRALYDFDDWSWRVLQVSEIPDSRSARFWQVRFLLQQPELVARDDAGDLVGTIAPRRRQTVLVVGHTDNKWIIYDWSVVGDDPRLTA